MKYAVYIDELIHVEGYSWEEQTEKFIISMSNTFLEWKLKDLVKKENPDLDHNDVYKWMKENMKGRWIGKGITYKNIISFYMFFEREDDAVAFKLRWL